MTVKNKNLSGGLFAARPTPLTIRETPLSAQIADYLDARNIYNDRLQCGKVKTEGGSWIHLCKSGTPDRFCIVRGQIIFIEVKMRGEKPASEQLKQHEVLRGSGAIVIVADEYFRFVAHFEAVRAAIETRKGGTQLYD